MAKETRQERNARLRENRAALLKAGFSKADADRYKGATRANVRKAIEQGFLPEKRKAAQAAGLASGRVRREKAPRRPRPVRQESWKQKAPPNTWGSQKGRIRYTEAGDEGNYMYLSPYTYVVTFVTETVDRDRGKLYERKIVSINAERPLTKKEVFDMVLDVIGSDPVNMERYKSRRIIVSSLELVKAVTNKRFGGAA